MWGSQPIWPYPYVPPQAPPPAPPPQAQSQSYTSGKRTPNQPKYQAQARLESHMRVLSSRVDKDVEYKPVVDPENSVVYYQCSKCNSSRLFRRLLDLRKHYSRCQIQLDLSPDFNLELAEMNTRTVEAPKKTPAPPTRPCPATSILPQRLPSYNMKRIEAPQPPHLTDHNDPTEYAIRPTQQDRPNDLTQDPRMLRAALLRSQQLQEEANSRHSSQSQKPSLHSRPLPTDDGISGANLMLQNMHSQHSTQSTAALNSLDLCNSLTSSLTTNQSADIYRPTSDGDDVLSQLSLFLTQMKSQQNTALTRTEASTQRGLWDEPITLIRQELAIRESSVQCQVLGPRRSKSLQSHRQADMPPTKAARPSPARTAEPLAAKSKSSNVSKSAPKKSKATTTASGSKNCRKVTAPAAMPTASKLSKSKAASQSCVADGPCTQEIGLDHASQSASQIMTRRQRRAAEKKQQQNELTLALYCPPGEDELYNEMIQTGYCEERETGLIAYSQPVQGDAFSIVPNFLARSRPRLLE